MSYERGDIVEAGDPFTDWFGQIDGDVVDRTVENLFEYLRE